jgi:DNA-binding GntR family transcriptional regulator
MPDPDDWTRASAPYLKPGADDRRDVWSRESARHGRKGTQRLLDVAEVAPPPEVAEALRLPGGDTAVVRRRLMLLDDQPFELTDSWYPLGVAGGTPLAELRKIRGGAVAVLADRGFSPGTVRELRGRRRATATEREQLGLPEGASVDTMFRVLLTADGVPYEASSAVWASRPQE